MESVIGANQVAQAFAGQAAEYYRRLAEQTVGLQERNMRFLQGVFEEGTRQSRRQTEANLALAQDLFEQAEEQREILQELTEKALRAYWGLVFPTVDFSFGFGAVDAPEPIETETRNIVFPIRGYTRLSSAQVMERLDGLSIEDLKRVRAYEMEHRNRKGLLEELERRIEATR